MRKFTTIFFALVLCVSAMVVIASAATNCTLNSDGVHDWTAWRTVDESGVQMRECACGTKEYKEPPHEHKLVKTEAVAPTCETEGNIAYWYCAGCDCYFTDAEGKYNIARLSCILPAAHDLEHVEAKEATCLELGNIEYWACKNCDWIEVAGGVASNILAVKLPTLDHTIEHVAAVAPTCEADGNVEYWYCTVCGYAWLDEARTLVSNLQSVKLGAAHTLVHVEAKASDCFEMGNIEYWYCSACDWVEVAGGVASNVLAVKLPTTEHEIEHVAAKAATCEAEGNVEYWYCKNCGYAWLDEARTLVSNLLSVKTPAAHTWEHHDAKAATCFETGNIAYDLCTVCGTVEVDGGIKSNLLAVILPIVHNVEHVAAVAPTATENGNIEYWYCKDCGYAWLDELCTKNTNLKAVILPATGETTEPTNPDTGDNAIFFVVALVAVATLGVAAVSFKKREN